MPCWIMASSSSAVETGTSTIGNAYTLLTSYPVSYRHTHIHTYIQSNEKARSC